VRKLTIYSSQLVSELRTSNLGPKQYYELYMAVFDALRHLSTYLRDNHGGPQGTHLADLYELVQYAGNIVPRLYLMITVGTVYMSIKDAPVKEIMKDMMEMSRGVQHPVRGLFLRYYLSGQARDYMPTGSGDGPEGSLQDSISFILTNFVEMNKLWVRLQHQGHSREREKRTQERQELQQLVGSNLVRLSQLVDLDIYKSVILQPLLEQVVQCRDVLAQEYLLEVITQVFPDEFHLHTLDQFLNAMSRLNPHVNVKAIVIGLMDRLAAYAARESESASPEDQKVKEEEAVATMLETLKISKKFKPAPTEQVEEEPAPNGTEPSESAETASTTTVASSTTVVEKDTNGDPSEDANLLENIQLYEVFFDQVTKLVTVQNLSIQDTTALLVSLANLALSIYPEKLEYMDQILSYASQKVSENANNADLHSPATQANLLKLLVAPVSAYHSLFTVFVLPNFIPLFQTQTYPTRRAIAGDVAKQILKNKTIISIPEHLDGVLGILSVLIKEGLQQAAGYPGLAGQRRGAETDETIEEQGWLARIVHQTSSEKNDIQFEVGQSWTCLC
jgi:vacuolar protein sorting-associated protein 35